MVDVMRIDKIAQISRDLADCGRLRRSVCMMGMASATADVSDGVGAPIDARTNRTACRARRAALVAQQARRGSARRCMCAPPTLFGESDEEKAARLHTSRARMPQIAQLNQQVNDLEDSLRRLTGPDGAARSQARAMSNAQHRPHAEGFRLQDLHDDRAAARRIGRRACLACACRQAAHAAPRASRQSPRQCAAACAAAGRAGSRYRPTQPLPLAPPATRRCAGGSDGAATTTRPQFDAAMNLLSKAQYDEARAAFRTFADSQSEGSIWRRRRSIGSATSPMCRRIIRTPRAPLPKRSRNIGSSAARSG